MHDTRLQIKKKVNTTEHWNNMETAEGPETLHDRSRCSCKPRCQPKRESSSQCCSAPVFQCFQCFHATMENKVFAWYEGKRQTKAPLHLTKEWADEERAVCTSFTTLSVATQQKGNKRERNEAWARHAAPGQIQGKGRDELLLIRREEEKSPKAIPIYVLRTP
jgi:hypothetical protein